MRVVTINTAKGDGEYAQRLRVLADQLGELRPDVVAVQESFVACDGSVATAPRLAAVLGLHVSYATARRKPRSVDGRMIASESGLALLTRAPLREHSAVALPWDPTDGERVAQFGILAHPAGSVLLINVHLTHLRDGSTLRRAQLGSVLRHPWLGRPAIARLLCGDFNATLGSPELDAFASGRLGWDVRDTYTAGGGREPRATVGPTTSLREMTAPPRCIDYIFSLAHDPAAQPGFSGSAIVLDTPDPETGVCPSDHSGVMTTLVVSADLGGRAIDPQGQRQDVAGRVAPRFGAGGSPSSADVIRQSIIRRTLAIRGGIVPERIG
jgi:endonuclease/exonuclease/phosphatase family metal-dependent hydrolase